MCFVSRCFSQMEKDGCEAFGRNLGLVESIWGMVMKEERVWEVWCF